MNKKVPSTKKKLTTIIKATFQDAQNSLQENLNDNKLIKSIEKSAILLANTSNRVIVTGMGKSGLIARKIAATLTSTGTPAVFLHPADALHGDMGNINRNEVVLALSNSGETQEIIDLLPHIKYLGGKLVSVTQKKDSFLDKESDESIIFHVTKEGCPLNLAPMASTTMSLIIGDALAAALIKEKNFQAKDFSKFHPSGALGKKLLTRVSDLMIDSKKISLSHKSSFKEVLSVMVSGNLGALLLTDSKSKLTGIITDGDIKRLLEKYEDPQKLWGLSIDAVMIKKPIVTYSNTMAEEALALMYKKKTYILPVVNKTNKPIGLIRMHDLVGYS